MSPKITPSKTQHFKTSNKFSSTKPEEKDIGINFRHLKEGDGKFQYTGRDEKYFLGLVQKIKEFCGYNRKKLESDTRLRKYWRYHGIEFNSSKVSENNFGIIALGDDVYEDARQFQLTSNEHGRVHGFWIENIFYIVWLDPNHELYNA